MIKWIFTTILFLLCLHASPVSAQRHFGLSYGVLRTGANAPNGLTRGPQIVGLSWIQEVARQDAWRFAFEGTGTMSIASGDSRADRGWDMSTLAAYFAARGGRTVYVKARLGLLYERVSFEGNPEVTADDTGISIGGGLGVLLGEVYAVEFEATLIEESIAHLGVALNRRF